MGWIANLLGPHAFGPAPTLTEGTESADVIAVAFQSAVRGAQQYEAIVMDSATMVKSASVFTCTETGDGAIVLGGGTPHLVFTTDATGAAEISVTDVAGASGLTCALLVRPLLAHGTTEAFVPPCATAFAFD